MPHLESQRIAREARRLARSAGLLAVLAAISIPGHGHAADYQDKALFGRSPLLRCDIDKFVGIYTTDVCIAVSGYARLDVSAIGKNWLGTDGYTVSALSVDGYYVPPSGVVPTISFGRRDDTIEMYSEARMRVDVRSVTELGTVRGYVEGEFQDDDTRTGGTLGLRHAYIQIGNWTLGKTRSTYLHDASGPSYSDPYTVVGDNSTAIRRTQIRYTQPFGQGVSLALAIENQAYDTAPAAIVGVGPNVPIVNPAATALSVVNGPSSLPDLVAALKWDREGVISMQVSGALHRNRYVGTQTIAGQPVLSYNDESLGFALLFGLGLDLPTGDGDKFTFLANYTDGASQYLQDMYGDSTEVVWGRCGFGNCILDQVRKWSVVSSLTHYWTPAISSSAGAGYSQTDYGVVGTALTGLSGAPGILEVASFGAFANIAWQPTRHTTFMLDVHYGHIDYRDFDLNPGIAGIQDSQGAWAATFEVTRRY